MAKQTPATLALDKAGAPYDLLEYTYDPHAPSIGLHAAHALGLPPAQVFKTLMVKAGDEVCLAVLPSDRELNLKALASQAGAKTASLVKPADAERLSGYHIGGISPLGQKKRLRCFLDASAADLPFLIVNGGRRGLQIKIAPAVLMAAMPMLLGPIATMD
jgi:Cys-tRNA(Pro)/Cys-tRNA(Cys) deacylase